MAQSPGGTLRPHSGLNALTRGIKDGLKAVATSLSPGPRAEQPGTGEGGEERRAPDERGAACVTALKGLLTALKKCYSSLE